MYVSCRSVGQQCWGLEETARAVIRPLKRGLYSFISISEMLLSVNADRLLPECHTFHDIRREIVNLKEQLEESEQVASQELQHLDRETEQLTVKQSDLAEQKKKKERELETLKKRLESHRTSLKIYQEALETERRNLRSAEDTLDSMRKRRDEAETMRNVGIGMMFIPVVGLLPGAILTIGGAMEMDQAADAVRRAKREVDSCSSQVRSYSDKVSDCNSSISEAQRDIRETDRKIDDTNAKLKDMSVRRRLAADLQSKLRHTVHQLGVLYGRGSVAESHTRRQIVLKPVMAIMEEMTTVLSQIFSSELLHTEGLNGLMWLMRRNLDELKALTDTSQPWSDYY